MQKWIKTCSKLVGIFLGVLSILPEITEKIAFFWRIIGLVLATLLFTTPFVFQYFKKRISIFLLKIKRIKVGISLKTENNQQVVNYCNQELSGMNLGSSIKFEEFNVKENDRRKFEKKVAKSKFDLIIWTSIDPIRKGKVILSFTHKDTLNHLVSRMVRSELYSLVSKERMFNLNQESITIDIDLERKNISEFSLFIVAICTSLFKGVDDGIMIFEKLHEKIKLRTNTLSKTVSKRLTEMYTIKGLDLISKKQYSASIEVLEKGQKLNPNEPFILSGLAVAKFSIGAIDESETLVLKVLENNTGLHIAHLNAAFIRVVKKKYDQALKQYLCYKKTSPTKALSSDALEFTKKQFSKYPEELGYLFACGFLEMLLENKEYIQSFKTFIRRSDPIKYSRMIEYAKKKTNSV